MRYAKAVAIGLLISPLALPAQQATRPQQPSSGLNRYPRGEFAAISHVEGVAPTSLLTRVTVHNLSDSVQHFQYVDCPVAIRAFHSAYRRGMPVWKTERSGAPWAKFTRGYTCMFKLRLISKTLSPQDSFHLELSTPTYEILADTLPEGRYYFTAQLALNKDTIEVDAGSQLIRRTQQSVPDSRSVDGLAFTASVEHLESEAKEVSYKVSIQNLGKTTRHLRTNATSKCIRVIAYATQKRRDSYYLRSARDDGDGSVRMCPVIIASITIKPGESYLFGGQGVSPFGRRFFLFYIEIWDDDMDAREPLDIMLGSDLPA